MSHRSSARLASLLGSLVLLVLGSAANAASLGIDVGIVGQAPIHLTPDLVEISPGVFTSSDTLTIEGQFELAWDLHLEGDPMISGSFTLTNLGAITQNFSVSATLGVSPIAGPTLMGGSFGDVASVDLSGEGTVTVGTSGVTPFYQAQIDGTGVQDLGFFTLGPAPGVHAKESFGVPIPSAAGPGVATSIGVAFPGFSLTAGDQVQTPFELVVVAPEPASGALLAFGFVGLGAIRARTRR